MKDANLQPTDQETHGMVSKFNDSGNIKRQNRVKPGQNGSNWAAKRAAGAPTKLFAHMAPVP